MKLTRYIPQGYTEYKPDIGYPKDMFACYVNLNDPTKLRAIFFVGKRTPPAWHYHFKDTERMKKQINESISRLMAWEDKKLERRNERKNAVLGVKVGDLFSSSWGYDQTNVDFYQCTKVKGKTFTVRQIRGASVKRSGTDYNGMADHVVAVKDAFLDEVKYPPLVKRSFNLTTYSSLSPTTEKEQHYHSWYA